MKILNRIFVRSTSKPTPPASSDLADLQAKVSALPWHHQIDFGAGVLSPGNTPIATLRAQADVYFEGIIGGKTFLDVGAWDGFRHIEFTANPHHANRGIFRGRR